MRVCGYFKNIDDMVTTINTATIKSKDHQKDFHETGPPSPSDSVITRCTTWLRAALCYGEYNGGLLVSRAKKLSM